MHDNNSNRSFFSHFFIDAKLRFMINQNWSPILDYVSQGHLVRPPEIFDEIVVNNICRNGYVKDFKVDCMLVLDGIIPSNVI